MENKGVLKIHLIMTISYMYSVVSYYLVSWQMVSQTAVLWTAYFLRMVANACQPETWVCAALEEWNHVFTLVRDICSRLTELKTGIC